MPGEAIGRLIGRGFIRIDADTSPARKAFLGLSAIGANALTTAMLPATAVIGVGMMSLANSAAAAGAATGAFFAAVKPQFADIQKAMQQQSVAEDAQSKATVAQAQAQDLAKRSGFDYGKQVEITADMTDAAKSAAQQYNAALSTANSASKSAAQSQALYKQQMSGMPKATQDTANAIQKLKDDWTAWSRSLSGNTMPIFTRAIQFLDSLLPKLTPLVKTAAQEFSNFQKSLGGGQAGYVFRTFGDGIQKNAGTALRDFLTITRNVMVGVTGILNAFLPTTNKVSDGLRTLTGRFANWGATLSKSKGFQSFMDTVRQAAPVVVQVLATLAKTVGTVATSLGPLSGIGLKVAQVFAVILDAIPTPVLQQLANVIVGVNVAMKLYAVYTGIAAAATWAFSTANGASGLQLAIATVRMYAWYAGMVAVRIATGIATAAQWLWNAAMSANPIGLVILGITALVAGIIWVATKTTWFQTAWKYTWKFIVGVAQQVWGQIRPIWNAFATGIGWVVDAAVGAYNWFKKWWPVVVSIIAPFLAIPIIIMRNWGVISGFFKAQMQKIIDFFKPAVTWLYTHGRDLVLGLLHGAQAVAQTIRDWISSHIFKPVGDFFVNVGTWLYDKGRNLILGFIRGNAIIAATIRDWMMSHIFRPVGNFFSTVGTWLYDKGRNLILGFIRGNAVIAATIRGWIRDHVVNPVLRMFNGINTWLYNKGSALISGLISGARNGLKAVGKWAKDVFNSIVGAIKKVFAIKSPSQVMAGLGGHMMAGLFKGLLSGSRMLNAIVKKVFSSPLSAAKALINKGISVTGFLGKNGADMLAELFGSIGGRGGSNVANQNLGKQMMQAMGWSAAQWPALRALWMGESGWNERALNKSSGAYGIPQSLPASKMASAGADWRTNPATQIEWGLKYIKSRYGSPAGAYSQWLARSPHWYDSGGWLPKGLSLAMNATGGRENMAVFTKPQWAALQALVNALMQGSSLGGGNLHLHVENNGVIASQREAINWLVSSLDDAKRNGRLRNIIPGA